jgi:uncharacterized membrane protein
MNTGMGASTHRGHHPHASGSDKKGGARRWPAACQPGCQAQRRQPAGGQDAGIDRREAGQVLQRGSQPAKKATQHFGGRMAWLPDGTLVLAMGDGNLERTDAQRLNTHLGKLLRINADGSGRTAGRGHHQLPRDFRSPAGTWLARLNRNPPTRIQMPTRTLLSSALIGAVASARSMTPMAAIAAARLVGRHTPGQLLLLDRPVIRSGALLMGAAELFGDKMKTAPDRTAFLGLLARVMSAGIAGAALAPPGRERAGAAVAVATAVPLAYLTLAARKRAMARIGQTQSGLIEDALVVAVGAAIVALCIRQASRGHIP